MSRWGWLAILAVGVCARSEPQDFPSGWEASVTQARQCYRNGRYVEAERWYVEAERLLQTSPSLIHEWMVCLGEMAVAIHAQGRLKDAENLLLQAIEVHERLPGASSAVRCRLLSALAAVLTDAGESVKAERLLRRGIILAGSAGDREMEARMYLHLGNVMNYTGNLAEAESLYRQALHLSSLLTNQDVPQTAAILSNIAHIHVKTGRSAGALPLLEQAIQTLERGFGPTHPLLVRPWANLAEALASLGRLADALAAASKARAMAESTFGAEHLITAEVSLQCAVLLRKAGRNGEAKRLEKHARAVLARHERDNLLGHTVDARALRAGAGMGAPRSPEPRH